MQEFIYYNKNGLDFPLSEKIQVTTNLDDTKDKSFLKKSMIYSHLNYQKMTLNFLE